MTFRTPRATPQRRHRRPADEQRQQILVTFGFIGVIFVAIALMVGVVAATYYNAHLVTVASVNGVNISKDQWQEREAVDLYHINVTLSQLQAAVSAGSIDQNTAQQEAQYLQQQQQSAGTNAATELIDGVLQTQLAKSMGITVTDADVTAALTREATTPEQRKIDAIFVQPGASPAAQATPTPSASASAAASAGPSASPLTSTPPAGSAAPGSSTVPAASAAPGTTPGASPSVSPSPSPSAPAGPTAAQKAEAKALADQALAELKAGTPFDQVARKYSTDSSATNGGDYGYITSSDTVDAAWVAALFKLPLNGQTDVMLGSDGTYRIGRVVDIVPAKTDPNYQKKLQDAGLNLTAYRQAIHDNLVQQKLQDAIVAKATTGNPVQVHAWEIEIASADANGNPITSPEVKAAHILYSPKGDPSKASSVPANDPSWAVAQKQAETTATELRAISDPAKRAAQFAAIAKKESNDTGSGANGGDLGWFQQDQMVPEFGGPLFTGNHVVDEIIGPVKSQYGWHVILFEGSRPAPKDRVAAVQKALQAPGADFAAIARANSDASDASSGGDMGWIAPLQVDQATEDLLFGLKVGQVSAPQVKSDGTYLYEVSEKTSRPLDASQVSTLKSTAFTYWYAAQKAKATIWQSPDITNATPAAS
jgi:parvulin-like peptidyl-prolyl isomerase